MNFKGMKMEGNMDDRPKVKIKIIDMLAKADM